MFQCHSHLEGMQPLTECGQMSLSHRGTDQMRLERLLQSPCQPCTDTVLVCEFELEAEASS